jgi:hypothetical protein
VRPGAGLPRLAASATLVVALALVLVPASVGSRSPAARLALDPARLQPVAARAVPRGTSSIALDATHRSDGVVLSGETLLDPVGVRAAPSRPLAVAPAAPTRVIVVPTWRDDPEISWYGPGLYGNGTACGQRYTRTIMGVAHRSLPCGTLVSFRHGGREITVPVIDRGPYVGGRIFDLSRAACKALDHCFTGPIQYRFP